MMTRMQLERAVAGATGESLRTVRGRGFGLLAEHPADPRADELMLALDCPFCRHPVVLQAGSGDEPGLAEGAYCDVEFDFEPHEVYITAGPDLDAVWHAA
jgi:hypothetical protein